MSECPRSSRFYSKRLDVRPGMLSTARSTLELGGSALRLRFLLVIRPGPLPNRALQRSAPRAAAERHDRWADKGGSMEKDEANEDLNSAAWAHVSAGRFAEAEIAFRRLLDQLGSEDPLRRWNLLGTLAGILNSLGRPDEGTDAYRAALAEVRRLGPTRSEVAVARYMLANQFLIFGDPHEALREVEPIPPGAGHVQCLLRSVAAQALWKLDRRDEARDAARVAMDAAPTDERRASLKEELEDILVAG
jgi:tetratricopeptide (TPR) repeat protein